MGNKLIFKSVPQKTFFIILTLIVLLIVVFGLIILQKSKTTLIIPEFKKEEVSVSTSATQEKPITEEKPAPVLQKKFTIQVASFQDKARAEIVASSLKQKGYQPVISSKELPEKGTWYRVFVGDFDTEEEARSLLEKLKESHKDSFIKLK